MQTVQTLPNYCIQKASPVIKAGVKAQIEIVAPSIVEASGSSVFPLHGSFVIPETDENKTSVHVLQNVAILIRGPFPASRQVGDGELLFPADVRRESGLIYGHFNLNLFEHFNLVREPNNYWISVSIFDNVSSVISVEVA